MICLIPIQRAVLHALYLAGNVVAYQSMLIELIKEEHRWYQTPSLVQLIEQVAIAKALGWAE